MRRQWPLSLFFVCAGLNHFRSPDVYLQIMPPALPWPKALIFVSGAAEIAGGLGALSPKTRRAAGWGLLALLVAVFPANVEGALTGMVVSGRRVAPWLLWTRLPLQAVFMYWVYRVCCKRSEEETRSS